MRLMPALPNVPAVLKVRLNWTVDGDAHAETIHHLSYTGGPPTSANAVTMANSILASTGTAFAALMQDMVAVAACQITDLSTMTAAQGLSTGAAVVGTRGTTMLAPGSAALVNHTVNRRYRGGKPRNYFPFGISSDVATTGLWAAAFVTAVNTAVNTWKAAVLGDGAGCVLANFVNVSYYNGFTAVENTITGRWRNVPKPRTNATVDIITGSTCAGHIGSQRRRNREA
jgi:hypothetical protein